MRDFTADQLRERNIELLYEILQLYSVKELQYFEMEYLFSRGVSNIFDLKSLDISLAVSNILYKYYQQ